jgi:hypothetical protein
VIPAQVQLPRAALALGIIATLASTPVRADEPAAAESPLETRECVGAFDAAQQHRDRAQLLDSRRNLIVCASSSCPDPIRRKCREWLPEVSAEIPSLAIAAKGDGGRPVVDVIVRVDGKTVSERLDGRAVVVDPGLRRLAFERNGMVRQIELLALQGQKNRLVEVDFSEPREAAPARSTPPDRSARTAGFVALGVGAAWLTVGAVTGGIAMARGGDLGDRCPTAEGCAQTEIDDARAFARASNVGFVAAAVGAAVGVALLVIDARTASTARTSAAHPLALTF